MKKGKISNVSCGVYFTIFLFENGDAYACGSNINGQLGIGKVKLLTDCISRPTKVVLKHIINVSAGYNHTLFLVGNLKYGNCYSCGENKCGELGTGDSKRQFFPKKISFFETIFIVDISAGRGFSLFLTKSGDVYACGRNNDGRLGVILKSTDKSVKEPIHVPINGIIRSVYVGGYHSYFLGRTLNDDVPMVWACGSNDVGQLGLDHTIDSATPTPIKFFQERKIEIRNISCSREHTIFITEKNEVYGVGSNKCGQLKHSPSEIKNAKKPLKLSKIEGKKFKKLFSGEETTFFITEDDCLYTSGKRILTEINEINEKKNFFTKVMLNLKSPIKVIRSGKAHVIILTEDGKCYSCGKNSAGSLGLGHYNETTQFSEVKFLNNTLVSKGEKEVSPELESSNNFEKYLYNERLKKINLKKVKEIQRLNKLCREKNDKINQFKDDNLNLLKSNEVLLKLNCEYKKIIQMREKEKKQYKCKIKELEGYISSKDLKFTKDELKDLLKWKNDRNDLVKSFIVLKEKLLSERILYNKLREKVELL